jgi:anti-sigma regulatory factor (Ser/Thr protein kinase)
VKGLAPNTIYAFGRFSFPVPPPWEEASIVDDSRYWSYVGDRTDDVVRVRHDVRRFLEVQADRERSDLDAAELVVGELIANAVRHGAPPFGVCIDWHDDPPVLCVVDRGRGIRPVYPAPDPQSEHGRGLLLVRALAGDLVLDAAPENRDGTRVVVVLPVRRGRPRAA